MTINLTSGIVASIALSQARQSYGTCLTRSTPYS